SRRCISAGRRSVPAHAAGARSTTHPGTVRRRLRSQALGTEAGGTRRTKRKEASHRGHRKKAGGVAASPVGQRRSVRTLAQQRSSCSDSSTGSTENAQHAPSETNRSSRVYQVEDSHHFIETQTNTPRKEAFDRSHP